MTSEEEVILKQYLLHYREIENDQDFDSWYMRRYEDAESEACYKHTLHLAHVWRCQYEEGFRAGIAYQLCHVRSLHQVQLVLLNKNPIQDVEHTSGDRLT